MELVVFDVDRVVEEHHHAIAREVLKRPPAGGDQLAEQLVVGAKHLEQLLRRSGLGEGREAAKVGEEAGNVGAVTGEQLLALLRGDERGDLRRDEAGQLRPLPLDGVDQACIRDRDRRLVGERLDELDELVRERPRDIAADRDRSDQLVLQNDRNVARRYSRRFSLSRTSSATSSCSRSLTVWTVRPTD